jgi:hypothetical protein
VPVIVPDLRLVGRWHRVLLVRPDGSEDRTSSVTWLQAGTRYVDLRLPAGLPPAAASVADLDADGLAALATVEGFAGQLRADGPYTCWDRAVDLQPAAPAPDEGRLDPDGDELVEVGRHVDYVERWRRAPGEDLHPVCAAELEDVDTGAVALLVRVGSDVAWARGRAADLPAGGTLADVVATAARADVLAAFDTEVALGAVRPGGGVRLTASSLPGRAGAVLDLAADGSLLHGLDTTPEGTPVRRRWRVRAVEGDPAALPLREPPSTTDSPTASHLHPEERSA